MVVEHSHWMGKLDTPDLCARIDAMKTLCGRLEAAQDEPDKYRDLTARIRVEANAICELVDGVEADAELAARER